jgi:hypothetical protein
VPENTALLLEHNQDPLYSTITQTLQSSARKGEACSSFMAKQQVHGPSLDSDAYCPQQRCVVDIAAVGTCRPGVLLQLLLCACALLHAVMLQLWCSQRSQH